MAFAAEMSESQRCIANSRRFQGPLAPSAVVCSGEYLAATCHIPAFNPGHMVLRLFARRGRWGNMVGVWGPKDSRCFRGALGSTTKFQNNISPFPLLSHRYALNYVSVFCKSLTQAIMKPLFRKCPPLWALFVLACWDLCNMSPDTGTTRRTSCRATRSTIL